MWAKWLHTQCNLEVPKSGHVVKTGYITPTRWSAAKRGRDQKWQHNLYHLGGPYVGKMVAKPMPLLQGRKEGTGSKLATYSCRFRGPHLRDWVTFHVFHVSSWQPQKWYGNANWLHDPCHLGGLESRDGIKNGHITPIVSGTGVWAKWLHNSAQIEGPRNKSRVQTANLSCAFLEAHVWAILRGATAAMESKNVAETLLFRVPTCGQNGYITHAILKIPKAGTKIKPSKITPATWGAAK